MRYALVANDSTFLSDLSTSVKLKGFNGLNNGLHLVDTLGLVDKPIQDNIDDHLGVASPWLFNIDDHTAKHQIEYQYGILASTLESYLPFISTDETRPNLSTLAVSAGHLVATNGHILKFRELNFKPENDYLFNIEGVKYLIKLCKIFKLKDITLQYTNELVYVDTEHFTFSSKLTKREYPKFQAVIPSKFAHKCVITQWIDLKTYKKLFNPRSWSCEVYSKEGKVFMRPSGEHYNEVFTIGEYQGDKDFIIGFNVKYLDNALNVKGTKSFIMKFNNELAPIMFNNDVVIMPLKL
jgi:hypothetical protein